MMMLTEIRSPNTTSFSLHIGDAPNVRQSDVTQ